MKTMTIACSLLIGLLAIGCGSGDDSGVADAATDAVSEAAESVKTAAEDAVGEVAGEAADSVEESPVARCLELAAAQNWKDALEPCKAAAEEKPDDLSIKHALQQAQAAAEG